MSIRLVLRQCSECGNIWSFNPDAGHFRCPNCGSTKLGKMIEANDPRAWLSALSRRKNRVGVDINTGKKRNI